MSPQPPPVIPYAQARKRKLFTYRGLAQLAIGFAATSLAYNACLAAVAISDYRDARDVVYSRDKPRRVFKFIERGRPEVFPSRTLLTLLLAECAASATLAAYLGRAGAGALGSEPAAIERMASIAKWKLTLLILGPVAAFSFGRNMHRVAREFEVFGDLVFSSTASYAIASLVAAAFAGAFAILILRARARWVGESALG